MTQQVQVSSQDYSSAVPSAGVVKQRLRSDVDGVLGDAPSREGKMKDVLDIAAVHLLVEIVVCGENPSNDADRQRFQMLQELAGDAYILAYAKDRLAKIKAGEILLSAPAKPGGVAGALDEAFDASTAFVQILMAAQG